MEKDKKKGGGQKKIELIFSEVPLCQYNQKNQVHKGKKDIYHFLQSELKMTLNPHFIGLPGNLGLFMNLW